MGKTNGEAVTLLAINLIEAQLRTLPITIAAISQAFELSDADTDLLDHLILHRKLRPAKTGSAGNIVAEGAEANSAMDFQGASQVLQDNPWEKSNYMRVVVSNALLAVGFFWRAHELSTMRTPEVQFLGHVVDAILNENTFNVAPNHIPVASFDGLVIDSNLNGLPLFGDEETEGFMEFGDAIALLQWLSRYLRGQRLYVSGGDAG